MECALIVLDVRVTIASTGRVVEVSCCNTGGWKRWPGTTIPVREREVWGCRGMLLLCDGTVGMHIM
jgi:hypothetical protein